MPDEIRCLAMTSKGIEDIAGMEVREITGKECGIRDSCIIFSTGDIKDLCLVSYKSQSIDKAILLLLDSAFNSFGDIISAIKNAVEGIADNPVKKSNAKKTKNKPHQNKIGKIIADFGPKTFVVRCRREGNHDFSSVDVEMEAGKLIEKNFSLKLDFKSPEIIFFCYMLQNEFYFGIDFSGMELQKRQYKIYAQPNSLRATIAYALMRLSGYRKNEALLDPFAGDGVVMIEAALYSSGLSPNYYSKDKFAFTRYAYKENLRKFLEKQDKKPSAKGEIMGFDSMFKYVDYARKNAKIAGVHDFIRLSRIEMEWLDVKLKEKSIDRIAAKLPSSIKAANDKLLGNLFYQAEYILKGNGAMAILTYYPDIVKECASKSKFVLKHERKVWSGKQELGILVFGKISSSRIMNDGNIVGIR